MTNVSFKVEKDLDEHYWIPDLNLDFIPQVGWKLMFLGDQFRVIGVEMSVEHNDDYSDGLSVEYIVTLCKVRTT